jgi:hypothetical protein
VFTKAKDDAKERSVGEGMEIVIEFKRRGKFVPVRQRHDKTESEGELIALVEAIRPLLLLLS